MPARRWTTDAELEYLQTKLDSFRTHQLAHTLHRFWPDLHREWFLKFPEKPRILPDVDGELSEEEEKQLQDAIVSRKKKVYNWFNNQNCQQTRKAKATHVNLNLFKAKNRRNLKETEVYSRKYYDERIKPRVQEELSGRVVMKEERLQIIKRVTKEMYDREDEGIKEEIREEVNILRARGTPGKRGASEGAEGSDAPAEATDERAIHAVVCQAVLDDMPAIFRQVFVELHRETGWYFMVMAAGEVPGSGGEIGSMCFHQEGDDPEHNIGRLSNFVSQFVRPFVEYVKEEIEAAYSQKPSRRNTSSPSPTAAPAGPSAAATPGPSTQEASATSQTTSSAESERVSSEQSPPTDTAPVDALGQEEPTSPTSRTAVGRPSREEEAADSTSPATVDGPSRDEQATATSAIVTNQTDQESRPTPTFPVTPVAAHAPSSSTRVPVNAPLHPDQEHASSNVLASSSSARQPWQTDGETNRANAPAQTSHVPGEPSSAPCTSSAPSVSLSDMLSFDHEDNIDYSTLAAEYLKSNPGSIDLLPMPTDPQPSVPIQAPMTWPASGSAQLDRYNQGGNTSWTALNPAPPTFWMPEPNPMFGAIPAPTYIPPFTNPTLASANLPAMSTGSTSSSMNFSQSTFNFPLAAEPFDAWGAVPPQSQSWASGSSAGVMPMGVSQPGASADTAVQSSYQSASELSQPSAQQVTAGTPPQTAPQDRTVIPEAAPPANGQSLLPASTTKGAAETSMSQGPELPVERSSVPSAGSTSVQTESVSTSSSPPVVPAQQIAPSTRARSPSRRSGGPSGSENVSTSGSTETASSTTLPDGPEDNSDDRGRPKRERRAPARPDKSPVRTGKRKIPPVSKETDDKAKKQRPAGQLLRRAQRSASRSICT